MAISFTITPVNFPEGTERWYATWYVPPDQWGSGYRAPDESFEFKGVPEKGWLYITAYGPGMVTLADREIWGQFMFKDGEMYYPDFRTRRVEERPPVPVPPPVDWEKVRKYAPLALAAAALIYILTRRS